MLCATLIFNHLVLTLTYFPAYISCAYVVIITLFLYGTFILTNFLHIFSQLTADNTLTVFDESGIMVAELRLARITTVFTYAGRPFLGTRQSAFSGTITKIHHASGRRTADSTITSCDEQGATVAELFSTYFTRGLLDVLIVEIGDAFLPFHGTIVIAKVRGGRSRVRINSWDRSGALSRIVGTNMRGDRSGELSRIVGTNMRGGRSGELSTKIHHANGRRTAESAFTTFDEPGATVAELFSTYFTRGLLDLLLAEIGDAFLPFTGTFYTTTV